MCAGVNRGPAPPVVGGATNASTPPTPPPTPIPAPIPAPSFSEGVHTGGSSVEFAAAAAAAARTTASR